VQEPLVSPVRATTSAESNRPNIILMTWDTVRADHVSVYGYPRNTTPNLQNFERQATLFANAISPADMTLSSHASLFTGLYPSRHGTHLTAGHGPSAALPAAIPTLAQVLSAHGYNTIGIIANLAYLRHNSGLNRGFQYYSERYPSLFLEFSADSFYIRHGITLVLQRFSPPAAYERAYRGSGVINSEALLKLKEAQTAGRPFFLFLNYMEAHEPYFPPHPFDRLYPGEEEPFEATQYMNGFKAVLSLRRPYSQAERSRDMARYDGGIASIDSEFGKLVSHLKSMGLYDNTIIVVTADHGQAFGERNLVGHGTSVYQDQVHVPLLIHFPGRKGGDVVQRAISGVDVMPTLLEAAGVSIPADLDGHSFYRPAQEASEMVFSESYPDDDRIALNPRFNRIERAIFDGKYKLIISTTGKRELYDLSADPKEAHNLYEEGDDRSRALGMTLAVWTKTHTKPAARRVQLDPESLRQLKSLGYVQ
jgi:arylsulfatase A-like enzyme